MKSQLEAIESKTGVQVCEGRAGGGRKEGRVGERGRQAGGGGDAGLDHPGHTRCSLMHAYPSLSPCLLQMLNRDRQGNAQSVTLTGWTALAGIASCVVLVMWAGSYAWRRYKGEDKEGYTLVLKKPGGGR